MRGSIINHLKYADDLCTFSPGVSELREKLLVVVLIMAKKCNIIYSTMLISDTVSLLTTNHRT